MKKRILEAEKVATDAIRALILNNHFCKEQNAAEKALREIRDLLQQELLELED